MSDFKWYVDVDHQGFVKVQEVSTLPIANAAQKRKIVYLSTDDTYYTCNGIAWTSIGTGVAPTQSHNALLNIQGGTSGEYFHLTSAQFSALGAGGQEYWAVDHSLTAADTSKSFVVTAAVNFTLPDASSGDPADPKRFTIIKRTSANVTITCSTGDVIADSSSGGTLTNSESSETYANVVIQEAGNNQWVVVGGQGTWVAS